MSHALPLPGPATRGSLLGVVLTVHAGALLLAMTATAVATLSAERPLLVDLLPVQASPAPAKAMPAPPSRPQPAKQAAQPVPAKKTVPQTLATTSTPLPAMAAPTPPPSAPPLAVAQPSAPPAEAVSQARFDVDTLHNPAPPYPPLSRRMQEEGKVILRVAVNAQGLPDSVEVRDSSGSTRLDELAQKTVRNWKFIPARRGETAIASWVLVPIIFKLES